MPIASFKPEADPIVTPELPKVQPDNYKSIVYDDNNTPLTSLIAYAEGAPWTLDDYFGQVLGKHNDLKDIDVGQSKQYQQYTRISKLEIRVDQTLQSSFQQENSLTTVTGNAVIYPFITPLKGDVFVASSGDNRKSLFKIIEAPERKTWRRDSLWLIQYQLVGYIGDDRNETATQMYENALEKSVYHYHFDKDRLIEGLAPILKTEDYKFVTNLGQLWQDIVNYYFQNLYNINHSTIVIPGQEKRIYDAKLVEYLMSLVSTDDAPNIRKVRVLPSGSDPYLDQPQIWSMLKERDPQMFSMCNREFGLVLRGSFSRDTYLSSFRYFNIDCMVYPIDPDESIKVLTDPNAKTISFSSIIDTKGFKGTMYTEEDNTYKDGDKTYKIIHEVLSDEAYVLSYAFYNNTDEQSLLEILTRDYINDRMLDLKKLYAVANTYKRWKRLEQFYYGPILLTLIMQAYRSQYS